jgi:hypothetical protein
VTAVELPRVGDGRVAAAELFAGVLDLRGQTLVVDARANWIADWPYLHELVRLPLIELGATELLMVGASGVVRRGRVEGQERSDFIDIAAELGLTNYRFIDKVQTLTVPRLVGARPSAAALCSGLDDVAGAAVIVDARDCLSMAQGYADELVKQVLGTRNPELMLVIGGGLRMQKLMERASRLRELPEPHFLP